MKYLPLCEPLILKPWVKGLSSRNKSLSVILTLKIVTTAANFHGALLCGVHNLHTIMFTTPDNSRVNMASQNVYMHVSMHMHACVHVDSHTHNQNIMFQKTVLCVTLWQFFLCLFGFLKACWSWLPKGLAMQSEQGSALLYSHGVWRKMSSGRYG